LHIPAGYAESILLHNICLQGLRPGHSLTSFRNFSYFSTRFPTSAITYLHVLYLPHY
ncbi:hypothetical protein T12_16883, partial [Trichinella patagoniensis]